MKFIQKIKELFIPLIPLGVFLFLVIYDFKSEKIKLISMSVLVGVVFICNGIKEIKKYLLEGKTIRTKVIILIYSLDILLLIYTIIFQSNNPKWMYLLMLVNLLLGLLRFPLKIDEYDY